MTILDKYVRTIILNYVSLFVFGALSFLISHWFAVPFLLFLIYNLYCAKSLRCPRCGKRAPYLFIPWVPQNCKNCGFSFVEEDVEEEEKRQGRKV